MSCLVSAQNQGPSDDDEGLPGFSLYLNELAHWERPREVVSPSRREEPAARAPSTVSVIDRVDLRRSGVRYLSDSLRMIPGIEVTRISSTESNVSARTYNDVPSSAQGVLALIDGRLAYNEFFGNVLWDALPVSLDDVDRIEVIRGPGSFVYGPNAMHGLVNIFTKSPLDDEKDSVFLSGRYGSYNSSVANLAYVHRTEDSGFKASFTWDDIDEFLGDENTRDKAFLELRYELEFADDQVIGITGGTSDQKLDLLLPTIRTSMGNIPLAVLTNQVQETFVKTNFNVGDFKGQLFWSSFDSNSVPTGIYQPFEVDLDTVDLDLQYSFSPWERHTATAGAGYRYATFTTADMDISLGRHDAGLGWAFVQDEFRATETVFVTAGVRVDHHTVSGTNVSPRAAAVWEFQERQYLRASAGSGFRNPSLRELWFNMPLTGAAAGLTIVGNPELKAEQMRSFELGYSGWPLTRLRTGANAFYNFVDERIVFELVGANLIPSNPEDEESCGFELEADYRFTDTLSGFANYSYAEQRNRLSQLQNPMTPRHKANVGIRGSTPEGIRGSLWANYFDTVAFEGVPVPSYALLNGSISYDFRIGESDARIFLEGFNLLDNVHREHPEGQAYGLILQVGLSLTW